MPTGWVLVLSIFLSNSHSSPSVKQRTQRLPTMYKAFLIALFTSFLSIANASHISIPRERSLVHYERRIPSTLMERAANGVFARQDTTCTADQTTCDDGTCCAGACWYVYFFFISPYFVHLVLVVMDAALLTSRATPQVLPQLAVLKARIAMVCIFTSPSMTLCQLHAFANRSNCRMHRPNSRSL